MRIYITGATGYLGGALARALVERGHEVRALVRAGKDASALQALGIATFVADITDRTSMREGMSGADWVIHAAAFVEMDGDLGMMRRINAEGAENVASLAYKLGVGRLLFVSSIAQFGGSPEDGAPATETSPIREPFPSPYGLTKHEGTLRVREWERQGLKVNIVYPSLIYGPPGKKQGANVLLRTIAMGRMPVLVEGGRKTSWVHLDDAVEAILRVMERANPGRDYILAGDIASVESVVRQVSALSGAGVPRLRLGLGAARVLLGIAGLANRLRGRRPPLSPGQLASLGCHWAFDDSRARQELDWAPRSLADGLPPTLRFLSQS